MKIETPDHPGFKKLAELMEDTPYAMLTTREPDGTLHSRPMHTEAMQADGTLIFLTMASSPKARELTSFPKVSLTFMGKGADTCIAIAGHAKIRKDKEKLKTLWKPFYKAWFPKGIDDPDLALLEITIDRAEYWETPSSAVVRVIGAAKAIVTGKSTSETMGEHAQMERGKR
jgi:general stress protein 26